MDQCLCRKYFRTLKREPDRHWHYATREDAI